MKKLYTFFSFHTLFALVLKDPEQSTKSANNQPINSMGFMNTRFRFLALLLLLITITANSFGQTTVVSSGMTSVTCPAVPTVTWTTPPTGTTFSQMARGSGVTCGTASTGISGSAFNVTLASAISSNKWYTFSITSNSSTTFIVSALSIQSQVSSATGSPNVSVQYSIGGSAPTNVIGSFTPTASSVAYPFNSLSISVGASQTLNIYVIPNNLTATGTTCRLENATSVTLTTAAATTDYFWNGGNASNNTNNIWDLNTTKNWGITTGATFTANTAPGVVWPVSGSYNANFSNTVAGAKNVTIPATVAVAPANTIIGTTGYTFTPSATQTFSSPVTLTNALTVAPASGTTFTMSGILSSSGALTQNGVGTTILSNASNSYGGGTTITSGTLSVGANAYLGSSNLTLNGGTLAITTGFTTAKTTAVSSASTIDIASGQTLTTTGTFSGTGTLTKSNSGILNVNVDNTATFTGGKYAITGGTLVTGASGYFGTPASVTSNFFTINGGTLDATGFTSLATNQGIVLGNNASNGLAITTGTCTIPQVVADLSSGGILNKTGAGTITVSGTNTYTGATNINAGTLSISADANLGTAPGTATAGQIGINGGTLSSSLTSGALTLNSNRGMAIGASNGTIDAASGGTLSYAGIIAGSGNLTKTSAGILALGGANTYTGTYTATGGTTNLNVTNALGSISSATINTGATIQTGFTLMTDVINDAAGVTFNGTGKLDMSGGSETVASITSASTTASLVIGDYSGAAGSFTVGNASSTTFAGVISGSRATAGSIFTKQGAGTLTLSGTNTYTGPTTITAGILSISADNNLGGAPGTATAGSITLNGGTLSSSLAGTLTLNANRGIAIGASNGTIDVASGSGILSYSGIMAGSGNLTKTGASGSTLTLLGANTYSGTFTATGGYIDLNVTNALGSVSSVTINTGAIVETGVTTMTNVINDAAGVTFNGTGKLDMRGGSETVASITSASTTASLVIGDYTSTAGSFTEGDATNTTFAGVISGSRATITNTILTKQGSGTLTLSGTNTYTGATTINAGTVSISADNNLGAAPGSATAGSITLNGGTLSSSLTSGTLTLSSNRGIALGASHGTLDAASGGTLSYGGIIAGSGNLTKTGAGTVTLTGLNTYSGITSVNAGELRFNPTGNLSLSGACTLNGGTLATTGITSTRTLTFASLNLSNNSTIALASGTAHTLTFTAAGTITSGKTLTITGWSGTYGVSTTGTGGKIFVGSTNTSLTCPQLSQIQFYDGTTYYAAALTSAGELIPSLTPTTTSITPTSASAGGSGFTITVNGTGFISGISTVTWGGSVRTTTFVSSTQLTATISSGDIASTGTVQVGVTTLCLTSNTQTFTIGTASISTTANTYGPLCNNTSNNISVAFTPSGSFTGSFYVQISNASGVFPSNSTSNIISSASASSPITATVPSAQTAGTGYRVRVVNTTPAIQSGNDNNNNIIVNDPVTPTVTIAPVPTGTICGGTSVTFTATPANLGGGTVGVAGYQWKKGGVDISGETAVTYTSTTLANGDVITCAITVTGGCVTSTTALSSGTTMTVTTPSTPTVSIVSSPAAVSGTTTICAGTSVTFTATPANLGGGSVGSTSYQWKKGGVNISGETASTYISTTLANTDAITCAITVTGGCVTSASALSGTITMAVNALPSTPANPTAATNPSCGATTLNTMTPSGGETLYWQGTSAGTSTSNGNTASTYAVTASGTYYVNARNNTSLCWAATNGSVSVTVNTAVAIGTSPSNQSVTAPATATFSVSGVTGTVAGYQWQVSTDGGGTWNNVSTGTGGTSASYTTAATTTAMSGYQYKCIVQGTSPCTDATSTSATLTVTSAPAVIYLHNFNDSPNASPYNTSPTATTGTPTGVLDANLSNSSWVSSNSAFTNFGGSSGTSLVIQPSSGSTSSMTLTFDVASGYQCSITSFNFWRQRSASGPTTINSITINGTTVGSGISVPTTGAAIGTTTVSNAVNNMTGTVTVVINLSAPSSTSQNFRLDDFTLTGNVDILCTPPVSQASTVTTANISSTGLDAGFTRGAATGTILVIKPTLQTTVTPTQLTSYTPNVSWTSAGQINTNNRVLANSTATASSVVAVNSITNLTAETQYTLTAYERSSTNCYNLTSAPTNTFYTLSTLPNAHAASFTCNAVSYNQIDLTFSAASTITSADGYLVIKRAGAAPTGLPVLATGYSVGNTLSTGDTIVAIINSTSTTTASITGLTPSTNYYFTLVPFNWDASHAATYNYRTASTIPVTNCTTYVQPSVTSDILEVNPYTYTANIPYISYIGSTASSTANSVGVYKFTIRDGAGTTDADLLPTILDALTINVTNINNIKSAALFGGGSQSTHLADAVVGTNLVFTGLSSIGANVTAADGGTKDLTLRVTFDTAGVVDNQQMQFTITNANTVAAGSSASSLFSAFASQVSSTTGDTNRIEVVADRLRFTTPPLDQAINSNLATFVIKTVDAYNKPDLDVSKSVILAPTGSITGSYTSTSPYSLINGVLNVSDVQFDSPNTAITLTATTTGLSNDNDDISSSFNIIDVAIGTYRTAGAGNWTTIAWQQFQSGTGWASVSAPATGTTDSIMIDHAVVFNTTGSWNLSNLIVRSGGTFTQSNTNGVTFTNLIVRKNGAFKMNSLTKINSSGGVFEVDDSATFYLNYSSQTLTTGLWQGTEKFHPLSNFVVQDINGTDVALIPNSTALSKYTSGSYSAYFGNIIVDFAGGSGGFGADFQLVYPGFTGNITHGNLVIKTTPSSKDFRFVSGGTMGSSSAPDTIGGSIILNTTLNGKVTIRNDNYNAYITVRGDVIDSATTATSAFRFCSSSSGSMTLRLNVDGNIALYNNGGFYFNGTTGGTETAILNLKGDITAPSGGTFTNFNTNASSSAAVNFVGPGDGTTASTTQTINIASTGANRNKYTDFNINSGAYVQLGNNLELGTSSQMTNSGTLDFGFSGTTPLILTTVSGSTSTAFTSNSGDTLKITSADGIDSGRVSLTLGNVEGIAKSARDFNALSTFWYIGKANQVTGNAIGRSSNGRVVICDLSTNSLSLTPSDSFGLTNATTLSSTGGKLDIRRGQFIETTTAYVVGTSGTLYMSPGTLYQIARGNSTVAASDNDQIPRMTGTTYPYVFNGGTIELTGSGSSHAFQTLRSASISSGRPYYKYVKFSGANTYGTDFKNLGSQTGIDSALIVTGSTVVDCRTLSNAAASFIGNGGLIMDGGRLKIKNTSATQPELVGDNVAYNITGGTVEFYGSSAIQQQQLRGNYTSLTTKPKVTYYNIDINADAANWSTTSTFGAAGNVDMNSSFDVAGTLTVFAPATFRMDDQEFVGGAGKVEIKDYAGLLYANQYGINASGTGTSNGNIRTVTTDIFSSKASYGFIGPNDQVTGTGLPATTNGLYVYKSTSSKRVTLNSAVRADSILTMGAGHIITGNANSIELGKDTLNVGTLNYTTGYVIGKMRRWFKGTNSGAASSLFPLGQDTFSNLYNRFYQIEFTNTPTTSGYLDVNFNNNNMALYGLPIVGIPAVGSCSTFDALSTEDEGYWVGTPQSSTLGDGAYTLSLTGEHFSTITSLCELTLLKRVGAGPWTAPGTHLAPTGSITKATVSRSGISGFSNFGFGGGPPNPLPVELTSFTGNCVDNNTVELRWSTASEHNSKHFLLQHSLDGTHFTNVTTVAAAGFSTSPKNYSAIDSSVNANGNYYRLTEIDNNGKENMYSIIMVKCTEWNGANIYYSPNGITVEINSDSDKQMQFNVLEISGKLLYNETKQLSRGFSKFSLDMRDKLANGIYIIQMVDGNNMSSTKISVH